MNILVILSRTNYSKIEMQMIVSLKFLEIAKEAIELYVPIRGKRREKYFLEWQKRYW